VEKNLERGLENEGAGALLDEIAQTLPAPGSAALWWLGQQGWVVKLGPTAVAVDLYLAPGPKRLSPPAFSPREARGIHIFCGTHDHGDHIDRPAWPALAAACPEALFAAPELLRERLAADIPALAGRLRGVDECLPLLAGGVRISAIAAAHERLALDPATGLSPSLSLVIEGNGVTLFHAGDACLYDGMEAKLRRWRFDAMLVPVNGRDAARYRRGCMGNMTFQEAADLCGALAPGVAVPAHYGMFADNTGDPDAFAEYMAAKYPGQKTRVPALGERWMLETGRRNGR